MTSLLVILSIFSYITTAWTVDFIDYNPLSDDYIDEINSQQSAWIAGRNFDPDTPLADLQMLLGVVKQQTEDIDTVYYDDSDNIPDSFDAREIWRDCTSIQRISDQANCGSCWAVSTAAAMSDRLCIQTHGSVDISISARNILTCCTDCGGGCNGGWPISAWRYWGKTGVVTGGAYNTAEGCQNYPFPGCEHFGTNGDQPACGDNNSTPECLDACDEGTNLNYTDTLTLGQYAYMLEGNESSIQQDIMKYGPVIADYSVYTDFFNYKSGVYYHTIGDVVGRHAVRILGWGVEGDLKYWLIANSWNTDWGDNGTFKILRGEDECGIETEVSAGLPA